MLLDNITISRLPMGAKSLILLTFLFSFLNPLTKQDKELINTCYYMISHCMHTQTLCIIVLLTCVDLLTFSAEHWNTFPTEYLNY